MSKKTDGWMPLYVADYLADTSRLTTEQHGAYMLIIMDYWRNGPPPNDDGVLASICRLSPASWRKHKPTIAGFFTVVDGRLTQKRIDAERQKAIGISGKRTEAAAKGAAKRWGKEMPNGMPNGIGDAMQNASQNDAPPHTPFTIDSGTQPFVAEEVDGLHTHSAGVCAGAPGAGEVCKAMRQAGLSDANPGNQKLLTLLAAGAGTSEFVAAAEKAAGEGKGFAYALGIVANTRIQAAQLASQIHRGALPVAETAYQRSMRERMAEAAPEFARKAPGQSAENATEFFNAIDVTARPVELLK